MVRHRFLAISAILSIAACFSATTVSAQQPRQTWHAQWISHPTAPLREPLTLHFRKSFQVPEKSAHFLVHVSADNRFILYLNGQRVGDGPARGDIAHWRYETLDLAPFLVPGTNSLAATVWNFGIYAPVAQISDRTAFLVEGDTPAEAAVNTDSSWSVEDEPGQTPLPRTADGFWAYMAAGYGETLRAADYDWTWLTEPTTSGRWVAAGPALREAIYEHSGIAAPRGAQADVPWQLVPDTLPPMAYTEQDPGKLVRETVEGQVTLRFANGAGGTEGHIPATIAPHQEIHLMLDRGELTTAYPELHFSAGQGARITLTYAEALYDAQQHKGNRNEVGDRVAIGIHDEIYPDGGSNRTFQPLWWRTWRYLDIAIETADQPLHLDGLRAHFTAYPFKQLATFTSSDSELDRIFQIGWHTAQLDAHETYMDTPYYEQLQYGGDTRIQALITYAVTADPRLPRQAIRALDDSRIPDGITASRYPSNLAQYIPTFSLLWIGMIHDNYQYRDDPALVRSVLPGTRTVLDWFAGYQHPDGLLTKLPWWSFIDWVNQGETPTYGANGESCITTFEYLGALNDAASLESALGDPALATRYQSRAVHVRTGLSDKCWSPSRGLIADNPDQKVFSQQANILGVLYDVIPKDQQKDVLTKILKIDPGTTPNGVMSASYYFRFYLARALDHAGPADDYLESLNPWRQLLPLHFSTWPETPAPTRSDSHAWSAHPIYDLLTLVAGIQPASPGFGTVRIAPNMGNLPSLTAAYPHPQGEIKVDYHYTGPHGDPHIKGGAVFHAAIALPGTLTGTFEFNGKSWPLKSGQNQFDIPMK